MRAALSVFLSVLVALLPITANATPSTGVVQGTVTVSGKPLDGAEVALVDIASGAIHRTRSTRGGAFKVTVPAGQYVVANRSTAGLAVAHAPAVVAVEAGKVASTQIDLVALSVPLPQPPPPPQPPAGPAPVGGLTITPLPFDCILAGESPMIGATIAPSDKVARARLYFKSGASNEWYYGEATFMTADAVKAAAEAAGATPPEDVPPGGLFVAWLPKPTVKATPITLHWTAVTPDLVESLTPDEVHPVVEHESDCKGKVAAFGLPPEGLTFFSATTGAAVSGAVLGAGGLLGAGAIALIVLAAGAVAAGAAAAAGGGTTEPPTTTLPVDVCRPGVCPPGNTCTVVGGSPVCTPAAPTNRCEPNPCGPGQICNPTGPNVCTEPPFTATPTPPPVCTECATPPCLTVADEVPICPPPPGCPEPKPGVCPCPAVGPGCPK